ncbi:MAG: hypothetical protein WCJ93_11050 [Methanomicrobiales archaeon]
MTWITEINIQFFKEVITAMIGLAIIAFTLWFLLKVFGVIGVPTEIEEAKNLLTMMMGLTGVVVGYYFGRAPADAQATNANIQAAKANDETKAALKDNSKIVTMAVIRNADLIDQIGKLIDKNPGNTGLVEKLNGIRDDLAKNNDEVRNNFGH